MTPERDVERVQAAIDQAINHPTMRDCPRCTGKGYHHGFGEDGHDPDWCEMCGGGQKVPADPLEPARAAIAALSQGRATTAEGDYHPLSASIRRRNDEWVLEISGTLNDTAFVYRHTEPISTKPEDVAGLPSLQAERDAMEGDKNAWRAEYMNAHKLLQAVKAERDAAVAALGNKDELLALADEWAVAQERERCCKAICQRCHNGEPHGIRDCEAQRIRAAALKGDAKGER